MKSRSVAAVAALAAMVIGACLAERAVAAGGRVTGTIHVKGTKLKAKGPKPYNDVVVYLEPTSKTAEFQAPAAHVTMDQKGLVFIPHVMVIQKGVTVDFLNSDEVAHNVFCRDDCCKVLESGAGGSKFMDLGNWGKGGTRSYTFNIPGVAVLLCKLHPEMAAYMVVVDTPYFTDVKLDAESQTGKFSIEGVPAGTYTLRVWNKRCITDDRTVTVTDAGEATVDLEIHKKSRRHRRR